MFQESFRVGVKQDIKTRLFSYAVASTAYFAVIAPFVRMVAEDLCLSKFWAVGLEYGFVPILIGIVVALIRTQRWFDGISRLLKLPPIHHMPTAWDWVFVEREHGTYVIVTLNAGQKYAGPWSKTCFASSTPTERDIYLDEVWDAKDSGAWTRLSPRRGILLCGNDIKSVEFFHPGAINEQTTKNTESRENAAKEGVHGTSSETP